MFPEDFLWGAATAAYQIEGGARDGGRGTSIWDTFSHTPGKTFNGDTGDLACDHFHRFREDVKLMKSLGLHAYRFSISWPRIQPDGTGTVNAAGVDFYSELMDSLLEAEIVPVPTLYHWDLPQKLEDGGGWPNRETADRFADYADVVFRAFGDRVNQWITLNEPWCVAHLGYFSGEHAPGRKSLGDCLSAGHTLLLAHGKAVERFRTLVPNGTIGITDNVAAVHPASSSSEDFAAASRWDAYMNGWFLDPIFLGDYPDLLKSVFGDILPTITEADRKLITLPTDFLGINYYSRSIMADDPSGDGLKVRGVSQPDAPVTAMGWEIYPDGLREILEQLTARYAKPALYITENGAAFDEVADGDGVVNDIPRLEYLKAHFISAGEAIQNGVNLKGYFVWSLMDNFEWAFGYDRRFGIVHVDYGTQIRTPKASAKWYAEVIASGGQLKQRTNERP